MGDSISQAVVRFDGGDVAYVAAHSDDVDALYGRWELHMVGNVRREAGGEEAGGRAHDDETNIRHLDARRAARGGDGDGRELLRPAQVLVEQPALSDAILLLGGLGNEQSESKAVVSAAWR